MNLKIIINDGGSISSAPKSVSSWLYFFHKNVLKDCFCLIVQSVSGVVETFKITTEEKCMQIADFAFKYAEKHGRKKVTAVHKANIMYVPKVIINYIKCFNNILLLHLLNYSIY